jgi:hypothetical protein
MKITKRQLQQLLESDNPDAEIEMLPDAPAQQVLLSNEITSEVPLAPQYHPRIFHAVNPGDLVATMGAIKTLAEGIGRKVIISQSVTQLASYYQGATHPTVDEYGRNVCVNIPMWNMLKPLIESQSYIHSFEKYEGQKIDFDFNVIRGKTEVNLPHGMIQAWVTFAFPDLQYDLTKPWIILDGECPHHIKKQVSGKIILNFTERYRNHNIDYFFLRSYAPELIFAGTEHEYALFCTKWQLSIPRLEVGDFLELAYAIKESRFILANQSLNWNLAEALKTPRILEVCSYAQNCMPMIGEDSFGYFYTVGAEYYFRHLYNKTLRK